MRFIEVFKTNLEQESAERLRAWLAQHLDSIEVTFDLNDCDRVMRILAAGAPVDSFMVCQLAAQIGIVVSALEDQPENGVRFNAPEHSGGCICFDSRWEKVR